MTQGEELQKCKDDPAYFYNTCTTQGKDHPLTDIQKELFEKIMRLESTFIIIRGRQRDYIGTLINEVKEL